MQACVHVYVCACEVRSQYEMSSLRQGLSMNLDPLFSDIPVDLVPEANCPQLQMDTVTPAFYMGAGDLNSALQACVAGSLPQNHHLRPQVVDFLCC